MTLEEYWIVLSHPNYECPLIDIYLLDEKEVIQAKVYLYISVLGFRGA